MAFTSQFISSLFQNSYVSDSNVDYSQNNSQFEHSAQNEAYQSDSANSEPYIYTPTAPHTTHANDVNSARHTQRTQLTASEEDRGDRLVKAARHTQDTQHNNQNNHQSYNSGRSGSQEDLTEVDFNPMGSVVSGVTGVGQALGNLWRRASSSNLFNPNSKPKSPSKSATLAANTTPKFTSSPQDTAKSTAIPAAAAKTNPYAPRPVVEAAVTAAPIHSTALDIMKHYAFESHVPSVAPLSFPPADTTDSLLTGGNRPRDRKSESVAESEYSQSHNGRGYFTGGQGYDASYSSADEDYHKDVVDVTSHVH